MTKTAKPQTATCRRRGCHATLTAPRSVQRGIGPTCERKEREEAAAAQARYEAAVTAAVDAVDTTAFADAKKVTDKAKQLILDGAIVPTRVPGMYLANGSDGVSTYLTDTIERSCTCKAGQRLGRCNHLVAAAAIDLLDNGALTNTTAALLAA
ncbi:DUF6011 domain-containing protein [Actinomadura litoris]|uniref:DUF6011 domain-containing protein n=1 Tax=Actinomadura litoris TaxID=2678616 RepID=UPI001FA7C86D|nr:DUF6011 domain-containing protein [Actinomadura litoris]